MTQKKKKEHIDLVKPAVLFEGHYQPVWTVLNFSAGVSFLRTVLTQIHWFSRNPRTA
jgi:hypothetical protein